MRGKGGEQASPQLANSMLTNEVCWGRGRGGGGGQIDNDRSLSDLQTVSWRPMLVER